MEGDDEPRVVDGWIEAFHGFTREQQTVALTRLVGDLSGSVSGRTMLQALQGTVAQYIRQDFLQVLPEEMSYYVLAFLGPTDLLACSAVSRHWRRLAENDRLWKPHCMVALRETTLLPRALPEKVAEKCAFETFQEKLLEYAEPGLFDRAGTTMKQLYSCRGRMRIPWEDSRYQKHCEAKKVLCHGDSVVTCLCIAGPNRVISCSDDKNLIVWQINPPMQLHKLEGHTGGVWSCATEGNLAVSGATDHCLRVWDIEKGTLVRVLVGHTSTVRCVHMEGDVIVSGSRDCTIRVWKPSTGECTNVFAGHTNAVRCIDMCNGLIASGSYDNTVRLWRPDETDSLFELIGHSDKIYSIRLTKEWIASGSLDTTIRVWSLDTGECMSILRGHQSLTGTLHVRSDGVLVSGNADNKVKLWDVMTGRCIRSLEGHTGAVTDVQVTANHIVSCSDDGLAKLWSRNGDYIRDLVDSQTVLNINDGVIWRLQCTDSALVCALGSRQSEIEVTSLVFVDFSPRSGAALGGPIDMEDEGAPADAGDGGFGGGKPPPFPAEITPEAMAGHAPDK
mmetsp:Transcript_30142/g.79134  ORF Transcript_30142/g.79134 Transcript_30142/m.79134 type:complete len:561 (+) Transcript_30142:225-1907(+)